MLSENIKNLRKAKGMSQEQLAEKLAVVRQTVSKWEKGISVPDSEMLIRLSKELDTTVGKLLGETIAPQSTSEIQLLAARLENLNEQFARRNESRRRAWRIFFICLGVVALLSFVACFINFVFSMRAINDMNASIGIIGGADGPTAILVAREDFGFTRLIIPIIATIASAIGIWKTKKR